MEIWKRGSIGRKWHSRTHKRRFRVHWRGRIWSGTSPQCVPPADGSRSIIYERGGRRRATFRILEHPCRGSWLLPSKRKSPGWCGHRAEIKESPERQLDIYIYTYIEFGHGPPWLRPDPDSARDTRSFEITMRQTVPRYDMGIESPKCRRKISRIRLAFGNFPISHPIYYRAKWGGIFCSGIFNHFPNSSFDDDRCVRFLPISQEGTDSKWSKIMCRDAKSRW